MHMQPLLALGIAAALREVDGLTSAGAVQRAQELQQLISESPARATNVLILDFDDSEGTGVEEFLSLEREHSGLRVLFLLSPMLAEAVLVRALRAAAEGYLLQSTQPDTLVRAVLSVAEGKSYLDPQITPLVLTELRKPTVTLEKLDSPVDLTQRERMLMQLAADGLSNTQIAEVLGIRDKTVRNLWSSLFEKIGRNDRTQAVLWAIRSGNAELR